MGKPKHYRPPGKKNAGNAAKYITRNKALNRLQIKLPEFRRLCILKGIHPREPKKKFEGHNKTYYHVKDINFLAHEPLLEKSRELKSYEKKIKKAIFKHNAKLAARLDKNKPTFSFEHLVKERYPSFIDALRDLDDPLTMLHLFATLPAETSYKIPVEHVTESRRLSLEWQTYIARTHSLRKAFISVKGIYYQAEVAGQKITWLTPHVLSQVLPDDVDFRVMLTFVEFYETFMGFVNFKLYHSQGLKYPPLLDPNLEAAAAELYAVMRDLSSGKDGPSTEHSQPPAMEIDYSESIANDGNHDKIERILKESQARLALLQERISVMDKENSVSLNNTNDNATLRSENDDSGSGDADEDEETRACKRLFKNLNFFLSREVPREALLFIISAFGGDASWEGEGAPFPESDEKITHQIVDRPCQSHTFLSRDYVQPQWIFDCINNCILLPTEPYLLGRVPPPHLSPFVNNEVEGYVPEYAETIERLKSSAETVVAPLPGSEADTYDRLEQLKVAAINRQNERTEAAGKEQGLLGEKVYREELLKEVAGIPYSASLQLHAEGDLETVKKKLELVNEGKTAEDDSRTALAQMMMPRKSKKLYEAMQMSKAKKQASVEVLKKRKRKAEEGKTKSNKHIHST